MPRKTDALKRLAKWLLIREHNWSRWVRYIDPPKRRGANWYVEVSFHSRSSVGRGKTLSGAIHAALDRAEAPKR